MVLGSGTSLGWSVRRGGGLLNACFFLFGCFTCAPDSFELVYWSTWYRS